MRVATCTTVSRLPDDGHWRLRTALGDLAAGRVLLETGSTPRGAAQFAHQAAEKALKAEIAAAGATPPRTHDLVFLVLRCGKPAREDLAGVDVVALSAILSAARYPHPDDAPLRSDQVRQWIADAQTIITVVARHLDVDLASLSAA